MNSYFRLMRFHKPIGTLLLLWPALWALWIAGHGKPNISVVVIFILGVIIMRAAGCVINDIADRHWDGKISRTSNRPLVVGEVSLFQAYFLFGLLLLIAFGLVLLLNRLTILLSLGALALAMLYPYLKRYTNLPQVGLGAAFAFSVPMAFAAENNTIPGIAWVLFLAALLWTLAFDTQYALADREEDLKVGIRSTAILFGRAYSAIIGLIQAIMILALLVIGITLDFSLWFYCSLVIAAILMQYQQRLIRADAANHAIRAFSNNQWVGLGIFCGIACQYWLH